MSNQLPLIGEEASADDNTVGVLLVDDHAMIRLGIMSILEDSEFVVVGEASSGKEAVEVARKVNAALILLDIRMSNGDGLSALKDLKREHPQIPVLMLTTYDNPVYMARAVVEGAAGYLLKGIERDELLTAMRNVLDGEMLIDRASFARVLRNITPDSAGAEDLVEPLTAREVEVLSLVAHGLSTHDIAKMLFVSEGTAKTHLHHIFQKLGVADRVQAAVWAVRHGVFPPDG